MRTLLSTVLLLTLLAPGATGQESAGQQAKIDSINQRIKGQQIPGRDETMPLNSPRTVDLVAVQKKTDELNELVKSLNGDVANMKKGMIAADVNQRLKRIEKLAKEIRQSLQ